VALETPPTEVHYVTAAEVAANEGSGTAIAGCATKATANLLENPVALPGNLCVYASAPEEKPGVAFKGIQNALGVTGKASRTGAFVTYEAEPCAPGVCAGNNLKVQGSWAVTAG
jgi:hypothetical protein